MAAANFSRDVLEDSPANTTDLIDFDTVIENPAIEEEHGMKSRFLHAEKYIKKQKLYNRCDWLKIGKTERCWKRCKKFYCSAHSKNISKGGVIPISCFGCGVGITRPHYLCTRCEKYSGL